MQKLLKTLLPFYLFLSFNSAIAAQCPAASEWSHTKGSDWVLSEKAQAEGWLPATGEGAIDSPLEKLPEDKYLLIGLSETAHRFSTCGYSLGRRGDGAQGIAAVNDRDAANIKKLPKPPFFCVKKARCFCETTAGNPEACTWEWK